MTTLIIGGTGFIGRRLIPLLAKRGEEAVCMDINPQTANFSELGKVRVLRGDVSQFDDVMGAMKAVKPDRVINLAYYISSDLPPRVAFKLNILGMDNCFEAARLAGAIGLFMPVRWRSAASRNSMATGSSMKTISGTAMCNTRCTRSSTNGRRRTTAKNTAWRSRRSARPMSPAPTRSSARSTTSSASPIRHAETRQLPLQGRDACADPRRRDRRNLRSSHHEGQAGARDL